MNRHIDTIFLDVGATLRYVVEDPEFAANAEKELMELVGATEPHDVFFEKLNKKGNDRTHCRPICALKNSVSYVHIRPSEHFG